MDHLKKYITEINDYPKKGIVFKDLNPIYKEPKIWNELMLPLQKLISTEKPDYIAGIESRGFISASALAFKLDKGFITIRKPNKLPGKTIGIVGPTGSGKSTLIKLLIRLYPLTRGKITLESIC